MMTPNMQHFEDLRNRINRRLVEVETPHRELQINRYPWLYGALGAVPSNIMFVCGNPSITGIRKAHVDTIDDGPPDIEAQWWGGRNDTAAKRFRPVLCQMGLKTSPPNERGGWNCYITNVVKEANIAGADQGTMSGHERRQQARDWADILTWEIEQVQPNHVFAVGGASHTALKMLMRESLIPQIQLHIMGHYAARGTDADVRQKMLLPLQAVLSPTRR